MPELGALKAELDWGARGGERRELRDLAKLLARMSARDQVLLLSMAQRIAGRNRFK
jgi:hypothetical protein